MAEMPEDPFGATEPDEDPFATEDDVKTGSYTPTPKLEDLEGRLVILVPRAFTDEAPKHKDFQKDPTDTVQDRYTADVIVLDGGPLTFEYPGQADANGDRPMLSTTVDTLPALFPGKWVFEQAVIGQLKKVDGSARPMLLGTVRRGPQSKDRKAGKTFEDIAEAFATWRRNPKGQAPRFSWQIDVAVTPDQKSQALAWWKRAAAEGFSLTN
jgi:hypothetical protein